MTMESFDRLEERVASAISMITRLREENQGLMAKRQQLETRIEELQHRNLRLQEDLESSKKSSVDRKELEAKKKEIENRVEGLLDLFTELDQAAEG